MTCDGRLFSCVASDNISVRATTVLLACAHFMATDGGLDARTRTSCGFAASICNAGENIFDGEFLPRCRSHGGDNAIDT